MIIADSESQNYGFVKQVYEYLLRKEERDFVVRLVDLEKTLFKDKEFKIKIKDNIRRRKCVFIHDSNKVPCEWFTELVFALEAMRFSSPSEINVIFPYTKFTRQDIKSESRISVSAKALADVVSLYATRGMTVDLHNPAMQEYFSIPFDNLYSFPVLINHVLEKHQGNLEDLVIVSPDLGGGKRAESLVKRFTKKGIKASVAFGHKTRQKDNDVEKVLIIGDVKNKDCLIVDDIIDTGNTIVKTYEALKTNEARKVYCYGTHGLFSDGIEKFKDIEEVMVSNTLYCRQAKNIELISLTDLFGEAIYRTVKGKSLSSLFDSS